MCRVNEIWGAVRAEPVPMPPRQLRVAGRGARGNGIEAAPLYRTITVQVSHSTFDRAGTEEVWVNLNHHSDANGAVLCSSYATLEVRHGELNCRRAINGAIISRGFGYRLHNERHCNHNGGIALSTYIDTLNEPWTPRAPSRYDPGGATPAGETWLAVSLHRQPPAIRGSQGQSRGVGGP